MHTESNIYTLPIAEIVLVGPKWTEILFFSSGMTRHVRAGDDGGQSCSLARKGSLATSVTKARTGQHDRGDIYPRSLQDHRIKIPRVSSIWRWLKSATVRSQ